MKGYGVVFTDKLQVEYAEVDIPEPNDDDVVVDVEYSWISPGTESSFLKAERLNGEQLLQEGDPWPFPQIAGYQKVGRVRQVGKNVRHLSVGDRVFATMSKVDNMFVPFGGHVSPAVTPASQVWKIPDTEQAIAYSGMVLTQVGYNCGSRAPVHSGDVAVVIGDGLVGQWTAQTLLHRGAKVFVCGRHKYRLDNLPDAVIPINTQSQSIAEALEGEEVAIVVDTVGSMPSVKEVEAFFRREAHWVSAGFLRDTGWVDIQHLRHQEITLHTPSGWSDERMDRTLAGITEGWLQTSPLITHQFPVKEAAAAWEVILSKEEPSLGVVLHW